MAVVAAGCGIDGQHELLGGHVTGEGSHSYPAADENAASDVHVYARLDANPAAHLHAYVVARTADRHAYIRGAANRHSGSGGYRYSASAD